MTAHTTTRPKFVHRNPVASFSILVLALGACIVYLVVQGVIPSELALAAAFSASLAGIIMTAVEDGRAGLKRMLSRLLIWRVGFGYWLFAFLFLIPAFLLGSLLNPLFSGDPLYIDTINPGIEIAPLFISFIIVAGLGQELGWTGFLIPRLQTHFSAMTACFFRAVLGGLWHLPIFIYSRLQHPALADFPYAGWIAQRGFLVSLLILIVVFLVPWSIFLSWIFNNTGGSLLLVSVLHGSEIWVAYWMISSGINPSNLANYWGYGLVLVAVATVIVIVTGPKNLSRKRNRVVYEPVVGKET